MPKAGTGPPSSPGRVPPVPWRKLKLRPAKRPPPLRPGGGEGVPEDRIPARRSASNTLRPPRRRAGSLPRVRPGRPPPRAAHRAPPEAGRRCRPARRRRPGVLFRNAVSSAMSGGSGAVTLRERPGHRMDEIEAGRMEGLALHRGEPGPEEQVGHAPTSGPAVDGVSDDGMADGVQMHPDLMGPAGFEDTSRRLTARSAGQPASASPPLAPPAPDGHPLALPRMAADGQVDAARGFPGRHRPARGRSCDLPPFEPVDQPRVGMRVRLGDDEAPDVSLSRRWTIPGRRTRRSPRSRQWWRTAFTRVPGIPGAGWTTSPPACPGPGCASS